MQADSLEGPPSLPSGVWILFVLFIFPGNVLFGVPLLELQASSGSAFSFQLSALGTWRSSPLPLSTF